jgi:tetratricopeptide (TPR) repeat protein
VGGPVQSEGTDLQRQLSDFLNAEMLHTLGAYGLACDKLEGLREELTGPGGQGRGDLLEVVRASFHCNEGLRNCLHRPEGHGGHDAALGRHPSPSPGRETRRFEPDEVLVRSVSGFYVDAVAALGFYRSAREAGEGRAGEVKTEPPASQLGRCLAFIHDPQRRGRGSAAGSDDPLITGKIERTLARHEDLREFLPELPIPRVPEDGESPSGIQKKHFLGILGEYGGGTHSLLTTIVRAMSEAHTWMHEAEHIHAKSFGPMFTGIPETHAEAQKMLRYALALNTFVYVTARAVPWILAEDRAERNDVIAKYSRCCDTLAPTYCMWVSTQLSLLALHRRAFTWWTMGKRDRAYRDFHKLTRLLRGLRRPAERRGLRAPGTKTFIEGMTGMSELHIGRIYRGQHAHGMALRYFDRASFHLKGWEKHEEIGPVMKNSHWRINLLLNEGKANYELGRIKRSLLFYARAWRAFLYLVESETHATANIDVVKEFIEWLAPVVEEPELSRKELRGRIAPLVEQFVTLRSPVHLRLLAADIVMRVGHLLFLLRLPPTTGDAGGRKPQGSHHLALECIEQAVELDPNSTLAASDLLKIRHERGEAGPPEPMKAPLASQWPSGSGRFEEAARVTEYTLQRWLAATSPGKDDPPLEPRPWVARELLGSFLAHTDSSNVKLAQVYRYLMQKQRAKKRKTPKEDYTLDFVCLRRYSSFFPFLPRPAAFRAAGGGYFVHLREAGEEAEPFGMAVDPGPDFIENLYRCGYSLADIQMIVITHDHADHIASLDALLALLGNKKGLGDETFKDRGLAIVGNRSVCRRYAFFNHPRHPVLRKDGERVERKDSVRVISFQKLAEINALDEEERIKAIDAKGFLPGPKTLRIEPVRTWRHDDANGYLAQGFLLSFGPGEGGEKSSILFTADTGLPPSLAEEPDEGREERDSHLLSKGTKSMGEAIAEADVVVAHLSSVPLLELRELAGMDSGVGADKAISQFTELWQDAAVQASRKVGSADLLEGVKQTEFLLNQIQFGFRSKPLRDSADTLGVSPFSDLDKIKKQPEQHLYLKGLMRIAELMKDSGRAPLLLIGELREELGTFRTQIASRIDEAFFAPRPKGKGEDEEESGPRPSALTTDIGLRVRLTQPEGDHPRSTAVLCTTCDLDNDLIPAERFHPPGEIHELCVKGEDEGVFYNCPYHDPHGHEDDLWLESVERYDIFGE